MVINIELNPVIFVPNYSHFYIYKFEMSSNTNAFSWQSVVNVERRASFKPLYCNIGEELILVCNEECRKACCTAAYGHQSRRLYVLDLGLTILWNWQFSIEEGWYKKTTVSILEQGANKNIFDWQKRNSRAMEKMSLT